MQKVARTLKTYGAYVVDRNIGTPFVIYAEMKSGYTLMPNGWDPKVASSLHKIRAGLRQVVSTTGWLDGNGKPNDITDKSKLNILSMRKTWTPTGIYAGVPTAAFDSWKQAVVFDNMSGSVRWTNKSNRGITKLAWSKSEPGARYRFTPSVANGATFQFKLVRPYTTEVVLDSGQLTNNEAFEFTWPDERVAVTLVVITSGAVKETASAKLVKISN